MTRDLGTLKLHQLELTWAAEHIEDFTQTTTRRGAIEGDKLEKFRSKKADAGERAVEETIAAEIYRQYENNEFS